MSSHLIKRVARVSLGLVCLLPLLVLAQDDDGWLLKFKDYAVKDAEIFHGQPASPQIVNKDHLAFRTAITDAARKGPNFAGHYSVAVWDCGSECTAGAVVDETTGKVFSVPFNILTLPLVEGTPDDPAHEFKGAVYELKSRLFIADGCPEGKRCATYYYEWNKEKFRMLRMVPQRGPRRTGNSGRR